MPAKHTTLRLSDALIRKAKAYARQHDLTLTAVMERALSAYLSEGHSMSLSEPAVVPSFGSGGLRRDVNLDDTSALLDLMDGIE